MKINRWIASSQHLYRWLLHLYPLQYRAAYEQEMFHLFRDQCQEAYTQRGRVGILVLWMRTLVDIGVTVIREHLSDPHAGVGLLEAMPNRPLPWKGVLLVLIPGLIFFISQVEQVTSNSDWFFIAFYRAGYFLILPVLLVWLLTRKFPIWGLIPLGLLYKTLWNDFERFDPFFERFMIRFGTSMDIYISKYFLGTSLGLILLGVLIWYSVRRQLISRSAWKWLGLCGVLIAFQMAVEIRNFVAWLDRYDPSTDLPLDLLLPDLKGQLFYSLAWDLYQVVPFLLLVFIGLLLARKFEGFSFLLLLGYLLPTIIFGRYGEWNEPVDFYLVTLAVLIYRFVVALVAPTWLVRAASVPGRQRAAMIPVAVAVLCHLSLAVAVSLAWSDQIGYPWGSLEFVMGFWDQVIIVVALILAVTLYFPQREDQAAVSPPLLVTAAE